jgi:alkanesulfonate monooxygenase SsuD/methylene tetrahydromethanopterin reductase-like flavin-dependent oxidoreductase (luciferase family)
VVSRLRVGVILPTFQPTPALALEVAQAAVAAGVDGLFCYDHLWPMGQPERPALAPFPLLGALASVLSLGDDRVDRPFIGTLVARVGLVPPTVLINQFMALEHLAPGRVIAGLGTGDRLSQEENRAYGVPYPSAAERRADLVEVGITLQAAGVTVWVAGGVAARLVEATAAGAALNVWDAAPQLVAERSSGPEAVEVTWAGPAPESVVSLGQTVADLAANGATWAVFGWPVDLPALVAAAAATGSPVPS